MVGTFTVFVITVMCLVEPADSQSRKDKECLLQLHFNSPLKTNVSCKYGIADCSPAKLEPEFPHLYNKSIWRAPAPAMISPEVFCTCHAESLGSRANHPAINLIWRLPADSGAKQIQGFDIRLDGHSSGYKCVIVDLLEPVTEPELTFSGTILFADPSKKEYMISVQGLPGYDPSGALVKSIQTPKCEPSPSGSWSVKMRDVNITYNAGNQELLFRFKDPPTRFEFEEYKVSIRSDDYTTFKESQINKTQHTFTDIKPGKYTISLEPYDPFQWKKGRCKCKDKRDMCSSCPLSEIIYFARVKSKAPPGSAFPSEMYIVAGVAVGVVFLILISVAAIRKELKRRGYTCTCFSTRKVFTHRVPDKDSKDKSRVLVFINVDEESADITGHDTKRAKKFIKENKDNLNKEAGVFIFDEDFNMSTLARYNVQTTLSKRLYFLSTENANTAKYSQKDDVDHCIGENDGLSLLLKKLCIVCCFLVSDTLSKDIVEKIKQFEYCSQLTKQFKIVKIILLLNPNSPILEYNEDIVWYRIPEEYKDFVTFLNEIESSCQIRLCSNERDVSVLPETNIVEITVESDNDSLKYEESSEESLCQKNMSAEFCSRLILPRPVRERYVSNDSGRGGSVDSYRCSQVDENIEDRDNGFVSDISNHISNCQYVQSNDDDDDPSFLCPNNIHFFPPEPSEISESDILESYRGSYTVPPNISMKGVPKDGVPKYCSVPYGNFKVKQLNNNLFYNKDNAQNASMDSIMTKMAALNARSRYIIEHEAMPGETYSLYDGKA